MFKSGDLLVGRYELLEPIKPGGQGAVWKAKDILDDTEVALKLSLSNDDPDLLRQFKREAKLLRKLEWELLPKVTGIGIAEGVHFLVMEFIEGKDLADLLAAQKNPFNPDQVLCWADQILDALIYLHTTFDAPIIHRDIKPANLKLTREGKLFLVDFGLAKGAAPGMSVDARSIGTGTEGYAPLEQDVKYLSTVPPQVKGVLEKGAVPQSDLYSLAATMYRLMTGRTPQEAFAGRFVIKLMNGIDPLQPADAVNADVPAAVAEVLTRALALEIEKRPASAAEMQTLLREARPSLWPKKDDSVIVGNSPPTPSKIIVEIPTPTEAAQSVQSSPILKEASPTASEIDTKPKIDTPTRVDESLVTQPARKPRTRSKKPIVTPATIKPTSDIHEVWVEHNIYEGVQQIQSGMRIHIHFTTYNLAGKTGRAVAYFYNAAGKPLKDTNGMYCSKNGDVSVVSQDFTLPYEPTVYTDLSFFMPYEELHLSGVATYRIQFCVFLYDFSFSPYARSEMQHFDLTPSNILPTTTTIPIPIKITFTPSTPDTYSYRDQKVTEYSISQKLKLLVWPASGVALGISAWAIANFLHGQNILMWLLPLEEPVPKKILVLIVGFLLVCILSPWIVGVWMDPQYTKTLPLPIKLFTGVFPGVLAATGFWIIYLILPTLSGQLPVKPGLTTFPTPRISPTPIQYGQIFTAGQVMPVGYENVRLGIHVSTLAALYPKGKLDSDSYKLSIENGPFHLIVFHHSGEGDDPKLVRVVFYFRDDMAQQQGTDQAKSALLSYKCRVEVRGTKFTCPNVQGMHIEIQNTWYSVESRGSSDF